MTRKHFKALADAFRASKPYALDDEESRRLLRATVAYKQWLLDVRAIDNVCRQFNGNFDRGRFLAAAGVEDEQS